MIEAGKDTQDNQSGALTRIFQLVKQAGEHQRWKELATAERFALEAQEVAKGEFGDKHQTYAWVLQELGSILEEQGRTIEARDLYCQALEILEKQLGNTHPDTLWLFERLYHMYR